MKEHFLPEQKGHVVYYAEYGNPEGVPILSFHGGPGSKSKLSHAERFDLSKYRVILFDQRGCGKSTPTGKLEDNHTEETLNDAERIREALDIDTWFIAGGSWGSTLALLYAIRYPDRVNGLLLTALFLADHDTLNWAMRDPKGVARFMPDVWQKRMEFFKKFNINLETQNEDILKAFENADLNTQKEIAAGVFNWEKNLFSAQISVSYIDSADITESDVSSARIFIFYEMNHGFIAENYILSNLDTIKHVPTVVIHGRYDILCPLEKAHLLAGKMDDCELVIATSSGHKLTAEGETIQKMAFGRFLEGKV